MRQEQNYSSIYNHIQLHKSPEGAVMEVVVGVGQCVVGTADGFGAGVAEVHHYDFASSGSSSCEVAA